MYSCYASHTAFRTPLPMQASSERPAAQPGNGIHQPRRVADDSSKVTFEPQGHGCSVHQLVLRGPLKVEPRSSVSEAKKKENLLADLEYIVVQLLGFYSDPRTARALPYSRHKYFIGRRPADSSRKAAFQMCWKPFKPCRTQATRKRHRRTSFVLHEKRGAFWKCHSFERDPSTLAPIGGSLAADSAQAALCLNGSVQRFDQPVRDLRNLIGCGTDHCVAFYPDFEVDGETAPIFIDNYRIAEQMLELRPDPIYATPLTSVRKPPKRSRLLPPPQIQIYA